jgi:hypothetical protein
MHIGLPKTGTSALQVFFAKNREMLLAQSVDYLPTGQFELGTKGGITSGNAAQLARSLAPANSPLTINDREAHIEEVFKALAASSSDTGLLSSEILSAIPESSLVRFAQQVEAKGIRVRLIFYVRSQLQLLVSGYIQHVKRARCTELPDDFVRRAYKTDHRLKYASYLQRLQNSFGVENVTCRVYEDARSSAGGLGTDFMKALGKNAVASDQVLDEVNNSLPPSDLAIMLLLNRYSPNIAFCDMVIENARLTGSAKTGMVHGLLSTGLYQEISAYFGPENETLARENFGREQLFPASEEPTHCTFISPEDLSPKDVASFMSGIVVRFHARIANLERRMAMSTPS